MGAVGQDDDDDLGLGGSEAATDARAVAAFSRQLPAQLGRYLLTEQLGAGGMAEVFLAKQIGPGGFQRIVVVKVLFPHLARSPRFFKMFQREATLAARLSHTNVVQVLELGPEDGPPFIAMEYVDGLSLHRLARRAWAHKRALPLELCAGAIADAALGLAYAHKEGLVHRDVSPDNLMITRDGAVTKVLDFGIAKSADSETVTKAGEIKGKVPFMAPELVRGGEANALTDIYALGVSFYWLVTGRRPFGGANDIVTLQAIVKEQPRAPRAINRQLPEHANALIMRMIARDPAARPKSATEVHEALRWSLVARHNIVEPFVAEMVKLKDEDKPTDDPDTSGFVPSVPSLDVVKAMDLTASPTPHKASMAAQLAPVPMPGRRLPVWAAAAIAGVTVVGALVVGALLAGGPAGGATGNERTRSTAPLVVPPDEVPTEPAADDGPRGKDVGASGATTDGATTGAAEPTEARPVADAAPDTVRVKLKAPAHVSWRDESASLGAGERKVTLKRSTAYLTAVDNKRGVRSRVPIVRGSADYGALPKGRIQVRAAPYAEIFLGSEARGSTPFHDVEVVAGEYTVTLKNQGRTEKRTVSVKAGEVARVDVRFP